MNPVILQRADHLEAGAVADAPAGIAGRRLRRISRPWFDQHGAPRFELRTGRALRVQFAMRQLFTYCAAHGVGEMNLPAVAIADVGERPRCHPRPSRCALPQSDQTSPTETPAAEASIAARSPPPAPEQDVVFVGLIRHQKI